MLSKHETKILKFIKYIPVLVFSFFSILITYLIFLDKNTEYKKDIEQLRKTFLNNNKNKITLEVNKIHDYILYEKENSELQLKSLLKSKLLSAHEIMTYIYEKYKKTESKEQILERIKDALRHYRFNQNRAYFFIFEKSGKNIMLPPQSQMEGNNFWNHKDAKGKKTIQEIVTLLETKEEPFYEWHWYKPNDRKKQKKKIGIIKEFKPYNLFIGTGDYIDDYEDEVKEKVLKYVQNLKYSKNGYVFITDYNGKYLSHVEKSYVGINRINLKDSNGFMITKEIINTAKSGSGFISYIGTIKPDTKMPAKKITYVKGFEPWKWTIATGFYTDELENQITEKEKEIKNKNKNGIINFLILSIFVILIFILLSFYISRVLKKQFSKYKKEVLSHINENRKKDSVYAQHSKMAAMGEMLQNIAHQWRQPLSSISMLSSGVKFKKEMDILDDEDLFKSMDDITKSTKYLSQTIEDFTDFFNPNKKVVLFNLEKTINKALNLLEVQLKNKNIEIVLNSEDIDIYGYENEFTQVIINICNNAKDELIQSNLDEKVIIIEVKKQNDLAYISIKDNAGGIKEDIINRLFEPYFTTKHKSQGTGIGLYMSREIIVNHMKGTLLVKNDEFTFNNKEYKGALFEIMLNFNI
ncbi:cache domain-containing protein [Poseidonibacter lekithochrous]|uniref:sensor histidine kinase n=1 Tax=Poseidonibacter TaxID=2321187 RepID=UPI001C07F59E|nr:MULTISPECIES: cache domain-containing protein [Poseidonibacter]MBU3014184.1 cache domain-containing protein [Poseidonibacter lekithochrous]MDO6827481.1 cache domain-containing protein [Poseidonibacter sp. 1_MG-2023]